MEFFDDKEEVIDVQLTQFGKYQLSLGKWKPVYYAFFDDNILYDGQYAGISEDQNDIESRIQENTPQMHTQHVYSGRETEFLKILEERRSNTDMREEDKVRIQSNSEKQYSLTSPLGNSEYGTQKAPRWSVKVLSGKVLDTKRQLTGSFQALEIPQIDLSVTYKFIPRSTDDTPRRDSYGQIDTEGIGEGLFSDSTYLEALYENILIDLEEINVPFENENFEIEVYEYEDGGDSQSISQLYFKETKKQIQNDILVYDRPPADFSSVNSNYVEYYFSIDADDQVDPSIVSQATDVVKSRGLYVDVERKLNKPLFTTRLQDLYTDPNSMELSVCEDDDTTSTPTAKLKSPTRKRD